MIKKISIILLLSTSFLSVALAKEVPILNRPHYIGYLKSLSFTEKYDEINFDIVYEFKTEERYLGLVLDSATLNYTANCKTYTYKYVVTNLEFMDMVDETRAGLIKSYRMDLPQQIIGEIIENVCKKYK